MSKKPTDLPKLVVILGPTASGKSALAVKLIKRFNGELISADSRQIYKGMDIGTGKLKKKDRHGIPHHLLDIAKPDTVITLADWQRKAYSTIDAILAKGRQAFLVGGTGLYISSILDDYRIPHRKGKPRYTPLIIGVHIPRQQLYRRINQRVMAMVRAGLENEVKKIARTYSWNLPALHGIGYREWKAYFDGRATRPEVIRLIQQASRNYAKRQMTWFRMIERNHAIHWIEKQSDASRIIKKFLL